MDALEDAVCNRRQYANPGNFAMIAKISPGLRKFRNHSDNFAILAKFRYVAKIIVPSEILQFRYL